MGGGASWTAYSGLRDRLVREGRLALSEDGRYYDSQEDVAFASPGAAVIVFEGNQNGRPPEPQSGVG